MQKIAKFCSELLLQTTPTPMCIEPNNVIALGNFLLGAHLYSDCKTPLQCAQQFL